MLLPALVAAVALGGWWLANAIGSLLLSSLTVLGWSEFAPAPDRRRLETVATRETVARREPADPADELARRALEPRTVPPSTPRAEPLPAPAPLPSPLPPPDPSVVCELPLRLSAATFDAARPERSLVMLRGAEPGSSRIAAIGSRVGEHTLVEVLPRSARFDHGGHSCWLRMFSASASDKLEVEHTNAQARQKAARRKGRRPPKLEPYPPTRALSRVELARAVRELHPGSYLLDRALLSKALARWDHVEATTRIATTRVGRGRGLRIVSLRRAGLLAGLGLRSGDVLRAINGRKITRKRDLERTIAELSSRERATLTLDRGQAAMALEYAAR